jgi:hypothetical protein
MYFTALFYTKAVWRPYNRRVVKTAAMVYKAMIFLIEFGRHARKEIQPYPLAGPVLRIRSRR